LLKIYLFGQPRLENAGNQLKLPGLPKTLPLWSYLLLHRRQPVKRATLAFALWPDEPEKTTRANLRRHLQELRRILPSASAGQEFLIGDTESLQWNLAADYWLDVAEFEQQSASNDSLAGAVALYSGDLLESVYDDWLFYERERLRNLYFSDLSQLILKSRAQRDYPAAIEYARQVVNRDPLREDAVRQLMHLRYESGDRSGALQEYELFARRLRAELDVEPMPETLTLHEAIVLNALLPGATRENEGPLLVAEKVAPAVLPFVGRELEMEQLRGWWSRAARGRGTIVLVGGEAGVGKSRLVAELAAQAEHEGARVLFGSTGFEPVPYQAVTQALRSALPLVAALDIEPLWLSALASLLPELRTRRLAANRQLPVLAPLAPDRERTRLFDGIARALEGLAQPRPVLLILEDLHWAVGATPALLEFLARRVVSESLLVVVTYREEETPRAHPLRALRRRLQAENLATHIALGRLSAQAVTDLVIQIPRLSEKTDDPAAKLYAQSEGHPFFLVELIRNVLNSGKFDTDSRRMSLGPPESIPDRIEALIAGRIERLSAPARTLAETAAVVGTAFDMELVREVGGWGEQAALASLGEMLDRQLVGQLGGRSHADYAFSHHLIQIAIYNGIPLRERQHRHARVAQVIEELYPLRLDELAAELAAHWDRGNAKEPAVKYYLRAAQRALDVHADEDALRVLTRALEITSDAPTRFELVALSETIHSRRGDVATQKDNLKQLGELAAQFANDEALCQVLYRQILFCRAQGERAAEADYISELRERARAAGKSHWQAMVLQAQATLQLSLGQYDKARSALTRSLAQHKALKDVTGQTQCYLLLAEAEVVQGHFRKAQANLKHAAVVGGSQVNQSLLVQTLRSAAIAAMVQLNIEAAYALSQQMLDLCVTLGDRVGEADAHARLAATAARLFHIAEARQHFEQAEALYSILGDRKGQASVLLNSAMLLANLGRYTEALERDRRAQALFKSLNDLRGQTLSAINMAWYSIQVGDYDAALVSGARGLDLAREMKSDVYQAYALSNLATAERELGALPAAIRHMQAGIALRRKLAQAVELATDLNDLTITYLRAGDLKRAQATADEMLRLLVADPAHMTYPQYMLWAAAQVYRARGESKLAQQLLAQAHTTLEEKGATIPDSESRATFLQMPFNREILAAVEQEGWGKQRPRTKPKVKARI
jgi:predicted ATPase